MSLQAASFLESRNRPGPLDQLMRRAVYGGRKVRRLAAEKGSSS